MNEYLHAALAQLLRDGAVTLIIRVRPGAQRTHVKGVLDDGSIKIDIAAAPEDGAANEALIQFLADAFDVPKRCIRLLTGHTSKHKVVSISRP